MDGSNIDTYGVYEALSVGSTPMDPNDNLMEDEPRTITCMMQPGNDDDPYGGHKQEELLTGVNKLTLPDGSQPDPRDTPTFGYDDEKFWAIKIDDLEAGHYRIEEHTFD